MLKIGIISTFLPTQCGIATYAEDLIQNLKFYSPTLNIYRFELSDRLQKTRSSTFNIQNDQPDGYYKASYFINSSDIDVLDFQHEYKIFGKPDGENIEILFNNVKKPIITTLHTVNFELSGIRSQIFKKILARSNRLFLFSKEAKKHIVEKYDMNADKLIVIPHGTPTIQFRLKKEIPKKKCNTNNLIFVSAGHMRDTKGHDIALKALAKLKHEIPNFHYFIIGSNHPQNETAQTYRNKLIELVNELNLEENITFINTYLPQKELIDLIQLADICLLPYTREEQSSSGILALMIACGRPIVATPFRFANSYMSEKSGVIADTFMQSDFEKAIMLLIERKNNWEDIMHHNHTLGESWNWSNVVEKYFCGYQLAYRKN